MKLVATTRIGVWATCRLSVGNTLAQGTAATVPVASGSASPTSAQAQTITVTGCGGSPQSSTVLSNRPVLDTPVSINSLGADLLADQQAISFTDAVRNDLSGVPSYPQFDDTIKLRGSYQNLLYREGLIAIGQRSERFAQATR